MCILYSAVLLIYIWQFAQWKYIVLHIIKMCVCELRPQPNTHTHDPTQLTSARRIRAHIKIYSRILFWPLEGAKQKSRKSIEFPEPTNYIHSSSARWGPIVVQCAQWCASIWRLVTIFVPMNAEDAAMHTQSTKPFTAVHLLAESPDAPHPFTETPYLFATHVSLSTLSLYCPLLSIHQFSVRFKLFQSKWVHSILRTLNAMCYCRIATIAKLFAGEALNK